MKTRFNSLRALTTSLILAIAYCSASISSLAANASGTWKWTIETPNGNTFDSTLALKQDGSKLTGTYKGSRGGETKITDGKLSGSEVSFKIKREFQENSITVVYKGKLQGDRIDGSLSVQEQEWTTEWHAKRQAPKVNATGEWNWSLETPNGDVFEATLDLKQQGNSLTGELFGDNFELDIDEGSVKGNTLTFLTKRVTDDGNTIIYKSQGTISGNSITGTVKFEQDGEDITLNWKANR